MLADCVILFSEQQQQLHRFNDSSAVLALRLRDGATIAQLKHELSSCGVDADAVHEWVADFLKQLAGLGLLAADWERSASALPIRKNIAIAGIEAAIEFTSDGLFQSVGAPLGHLIAEGSGAGATWRVGKAGDFLLIAEDDGPATVVDRAFAAVLFKGMLLEHVLGTAKQLCALHAACLIGDHGAMLLLGAPGAGKTTLTLTLVDHGFRYASDDVTLVLSGGAVRGVPLAPGVKAGSWDKFDGLTDVPIHLRPDGQQVRFAPLGSFDATSAHRVRTIVSLRRAPGQAAALEPIPPSQALVDLFRESRSPDGACSTDIVQALAAMVGDADCFDLHYTDVADAAPLLAQRARNG